jgi:urease alpha subunit
MQQAAVPVMGTKAMGQATNGSSVETLLMITNALIIDWSGIYKVRYLFFKSIIHS